MFPPELLADLDGSKNIDLLSTAWLAKLRNRVKEMQQRDLPMVTGQSNARTTGHIQAERSIQDVPIDAEPQLAELGLSDETILH